MEAKIIYIADSAINDLLDEQIRSLLFQCFGGFRDRRYFREQPKHRWLMYDGDRLIAHTAAHEKKLFALREIRCAGISEVCVALDYRRRGFVRLLLNQAHHWLRTRGFEWSLLFGIEDVYRSSGYRLYEIEHDEGGERERISILGRPLIEDIAIDGAYLPGWRF